MNVLLVGSSQGLVAIVDMSSPVCAIVVDKLSEHEGSPITALDSIVTDEGNDETGEATLAMYWLAASHDTRLSVWRSRWTANGSHVCERVDCLILKNEPQHQQQQQATTTTSRSRREWLDFAPTLAQFVDETRLAYVAYKKLVLYDFRRKRSVRSLPLADWPECMSVCGDLVALGTKSRRLIVRHLSSEHKSATQHYAQHSDSVASVCFSSDRTRLFSAAFNEIFIWNVRS